MLAEFGKPPALPPKLPGSSQDAIPWYFKPGMLVVAFLVVGPLMLPLLWLSPHLSRSSKIVWTVVIGVVSFVLGLATFKAYGVLKEYYKMMGF